MRKINFIIAALFLLNTCFAQTATHNRSLKIKLDPAQTEIHWKVSGLHTVRGTFKLKDGEFLVDPYTGVAQGEILVDATTAQLSARDKQLQDEVLESDRYPGIIFHPTQFKNGFPAEAGSHETTVDGTFNIHGNDHPLQMPVKLQISPGGVTAVSQFSVPYVAWGLKNPSTFFHRFSKQIEVQIMAKGSIEHVE